jgi:membrane-associated phospholipid phosphatase
VGSGAMIALVLILSVKMLTPLQWYLIAAFIAAGLTLSSRLKLNMHNPQQVWVGLLTGFFGMALFMNLL